MANIPIYPTFEYSTGKGNPAAPPPRPKADFTPMPASQKIRPPLGPWTRGAMNPNQPVGNVIPASPRGPQEEEEGDRYGVDRSGQILQSAIDIYQSMPGPATPQRRGGGVIYPQPTPERQSWRYGSPSDIRQAKTGGSMGGIPVGPSRMGDMAMTPIPMPEFTPTPYPEAPEYEAPEYEPPEEDTAFERRRRQELMGPAIQDLKQMTRESILSTRSLANPLARRQVARDTMKQFRTGLGQIYGAATREAGAEQARRRQEQLKIYNMQYSNLKDEAMTRYESEFNKMVQDWIAQNEAGQMKYKAELADYMAQSPQQKEAAGRTPAERRYYGGRPAGVVGGYMSGFQPY